MSRLSIVQGQFQNYYGWFRANAMSHFGQSFVAESKVLSSVSFKMDIGGAVADVSYRVLLKDLATGLIIYTSPDAVLKAIPGESPAYGRPSEFREVQIGLGNTAVTLGEKYAVIVQLLGGHSGIETAINAANTYTNGTMIFGKDATTMRTLPTLDMAMVIEGIDNTSPTAIADSVEVLENASQTIEVLANDADPDLQDTKTVTGVDADQIKGQIEVAPNQSAVIYSTGAAYDYLPAGQTATESFSYTMADTAGASSTATVSVTITGANDAPIAVADTGSTLADASDLVLQVLANDSDVDQGDKRTLVSLDTSGTLGQATIKPDDTVQYQPGTAYQYLGAGATASDRFTYTVKDIAGATASATVTVNVTGVNDAITAIDDTANASEGSGPLLIDVLSNDTDPDVGDTRELVAVDVAGTVGKVTISPGGTLTYQFGAAFQWLGLGATAKDTFHYTVRDSAGASSKGEVVVTVSGINDAPLAAADSATTGEDDASLKIDVLANDTDVDLGDEKHVAAIDTTGVAGTVKINADGSLTYQPGMAFQHLAAGATATERIGYTLKDQWGASSDAVVTVTVVGANDAINAVADSAAVNEDGGQALIDVLANDIDPDAGDAKTVIDITATGLAGSAILNGDGTVSYSAGNAFQSLAAGATATETLSYRVRDNAGAISTGAVTITINGSNDAPVAAADSANVAEDASVTIDVLANDSDIDVGDAKTLVSVSQAASGASVSIVDGKIVYVANADVHDLLKEGDAATDNFTYTMKDSAGATSTATVTVTVNGVRDGQVIYGTNRSDANLNGTAADELIDGGNGDDTIQGLDGADTLAGGNGNDILYGGQGIDTLYGNNGQDVLDGGIGDDQLYGGAGDDKFIIGAKAGKDTIWDFKPQNDVIQLSQQSVSGFQALLQRASEVDGKVIFDLGDGASLTLVGVSLSALTSAHFHFAS